MQAHMVLTGWSALAGIGSTMATLIAWRHVPRPVPPEMGPNLDRRSLRSYLGLRLTNQPDLAPVGLRSHSAARDPSIRLKALAGVRPGGPPPVV